MANYTLELPGCRCFPQDYQPIILYELERMIIISGEGVEGRNVDLVAYPHSKLREMRKRALYSHM